MLLGRLNRSAYQALHTFRMRVFGPPRDNFFDNLEKLTPATDKNKTFPSSRSIHPSHSIGYTFLTQVLTTGFYISVTIPQVQAANFLTVFHDNFLLF